MVEPEWNDHYRDLVEALDLHDRDCCPGCGMHPFILAHPELFHLTLEDQVCEMCKVKDRHNRIVEERDSAFLKKHKDAPPDMWRPNDGLHVVPRSLTAAQAAQRRRIDRGGASDG